jgi:hypothetical protein
MRPNVENHRTAERKDAAWWDPEYDATAKASAICQDSMAAISIGSSNTDFSVAPYPFPQENTDSQILSEC